MAGNYVEILVKSRDEAAPDLKRLQERLKELGGEVETARVGVDDTAAAAKLDRLKAKLLEMKKYEDPEIKLSMSGALRVEAQIHMVEASLDRLKAKTDEMKVEADAAGATGLIGRLLTGAGGAVTSMPPVITGLLAALPVLLPEVVAVGSGFAAAGAGAAAFGLLAMPAIKQVQNAYAGLNAAQQKYDQALALDKLDPTKGHAAALKAALDQLNLAGQAIGKLPQDEQKAVDGLYQLRQEFSKLSTAIRPLAFKIFADGLQAVNNVLPRLLPMAQAFGTAFAGLMKQLDTFTASAGFKSWLSQFTSLIGPATTAIGHGIGQIAIQFGKLLTIFSGKDVAHGINIAFDVIKGAIKAVILAIEGLRTAWDRLSNTPTFKRIVNDFKTAWDQISQIGKKKPDFSAISNAVKDAINTAVTWLGKRAGPLINGALNAVESWLNKNAGTLLVPVGKAIVQGLISGMESQIPNLIKMAFTIESVIVGNKGPIEHDRVILFPAGQAIMDGLMGGIGSRVPDLKAQLGGISGMISGPGFGGGRGPVGGGALQLQVVPGGGSAFEQFMVTALREWVRVRGGGNVQTAFGRS